MIRKRTVTAPKIFYHTVTDCLHRILPPFFFCKLRATAQPRSDTFKEVAGSGHLPNATRVRNALGCRISAGQEFELVTFRLPDIAGCSILRFWHAQPTLAKTLPFLLILVRPCHIQCLIPVQFYLKSGIPGGAMLMGAKHPNKLLSKQAVLHDQILLGTMFGSFVHFLIQPSRCWHLLLRQLCPRPKLS
jgi:hypothetical protein